MDHDIQVLYADLIIASVQLRQTVADSFFVASLDAKLKDFINAFVRSSHEAQVRSVNSLSELFAQLQHLGLGEPLSLLTCQEQLLRYKLVLLRQNNVVPAKKEAPVRKAQVVNKKSARFPQRAKRANQVREEILEFIQTEREVRTKDLFGQFSAISHRTIQRSLKELVTQGLVAKRSENNATHYLAV